MGDGHAERFGPLFSLAGETLNAGGDFFTERAAFVALPLLDAREIVAESGLKPIVRTHADEQNQVEDDEQRKERKQNG